MTAPCEPWPLVDGCTAGIPLDPTDRDEQQQQAVDTATGLLWRLTAGRFGLCPELLRPCRRSCVRPYSAMGPRLWHGQWFNIGCLCTSDTCSCGPVSELTVPGPIHQDPQHPVEISIDGQLFHDFTVYDHNRLVRTDGGVWPDCQDLTKPASAEGTWAVVYLRGTPVPAEGQRAVSMLAAELYKACLGDRGCKLPSRVQQISREGITYTMLDPQEFLDQGRVGIYEVDLWLRSVNPRGVLSPSVVWSPDAAKLRKPRRQQR